MNTLEMNSTDEAKKSAAAEAVNTCIRSGMRVGLGTGSTASFAVKRLAERIAAGEVKDIICASTSEATRRLAESLGIRVLPLDEIELPLDVAIDGADEVLATDKGLVLIKGRGGALLREKIVEVHTKSFICVADEGKIVTADTFGTSGAVPLEVVPFGAMATRRAALAAAVAVFSGGDLEAGEARQGAACVETAAAELGVSAVFRKKQQSEDLFVSDNGNYCLDLYFKRPIPDAEKLHNCLIQVVGVVETGLFIGICSRCIVGHPSGAPTTLSV